MLGTPVDPAKKRKIDINVSLCIICQEEGPSSKKCTTPNVDTLKKVLDLAKERFSYGDSTVKDFCERVESTNTEELKENNFFWHKDCYSNLGNIAKRDRAKARYEAAMSTGDANVSRRKAGRPIKSTLNDEFSQGIQESSSRHTRSSQLPYDRDSCIICQVPGGKLHKVEFTKTEKKMLECASKFEDKSLHVRLNSVCDPSDAVANDVQYHLKCWIYLQRKTNKDDNSNVQEINNVAQVTSDIEVLNLVEAELKEPSKIVLDMNTVNTTYKNILLENGLDNKFIKENYKKYLKGLIEENIPAAKFVRSFRLIEPEKICSDATQRQALENAVSQNTSDDLNLLFQAAKLIRAEISKEEEWTFQGTFENFQMPKLLYTLIKWIIVEPHMELQSEIREGRIDNTVSVLTQVIMQTFKTTRQVNYKPKCETNEKAFYDKRETPLNVGLGL